MSGQRTQWNEATRVQMPALVHLTRIGFTYFGKITEDKAGTVYDPDTNILIEVFKSQFAKLNPERAGEAEAVLNSMKPNGKAAIVLPTGFLTAKSSVEGKLLKHIVNERLVYGVISMPSNVFANTGTNVSVVFFDNSKSSDKVILIDASKLGEEYQEGNNKKVRLTPSEIDMIVDTFLNKKTVEDFSVAVSYEDIEAKKCSLAAGQYFDVKVEYVELTQEEFESKMSELTSNLQSYFDEGNVLQKEIMEQLKRVKYEQI